MISVEDVAAIFREPDREKREAMIEALSEEEAKYILKCYANFLNRWDEK